MPAWVTFNFAAFLPFGFALVAIACAWQSIKHRALYALLSVFVFAGAQDIGMAPQRDWMPTRTQPYAELLRQDITSRLTADIVSAAIGGLIMWRLARAFRQTPHSPGS